MLYVTGLITPYFTLYLTPLFIYTIHTYTTLYTQHYTYNHYTPNHYTYNHYTPKHYTHNHYTHNTLIWFLLYVFYCENFVSTYASI